MSMIKPVRWGFDPALVEPEWMTLMGRCVFALPFWDRENIDTFPRDVINGVKASFTSGKPSNVHPLSTSIGTVWQWDPDVDYSSEVEFTGNFATSFHSGPRTLELSVWIPTSLDSHSHQILAAYPYTITLAWQNSRHELRIDITTSGTYRRRLWATSFPYRDQFVHIVTTYNGSTAPTMWINGVEIAGTSQNGSGTDTSGTNLITLSNSSTEIFVGYFNLLRAYNTQLGTTDIIRLSRDPFASLRYRELSGRVLHERRKYYRQGWNRR